MHGRAGVQGGKMMAEGATTKEKGRETDGESSQLCTGRVCRLSRRAKYSH